MTNNDNLDVVTHESPAWRERANFIIAARLDEDANKEGLVWEQLWARELGENIFEICCIPFFSYGLALGDIVETRPYDAKRYVVSSRLKTKGHFTLRVWFQNQIEESLLESISSSGFAVERRYKTGRLVSIDAPSSEKRKELEQMLESQAISEGFFWENGS
jgi:hypothetical protein